MVVVIIDIVVTATPSASQGPLSLGLVQNLEQGPFWA